MAHHVSGLGLGPTSMDPRSHITDLFLFPGAPGRTVLVMDINPTSPFTADAVDPESVYEFGVDTDGDAVTDVAFRVTFSADVSTASVERDGETVVADAPVDQVTTAGDVHFFAGLRSDPFFADPVGAANGFHWTGTDLFADKNVFAIVLEVPDEVLAPQVGVWARVMVPHDGQLVQGDRAGRPGVDATFNQSDDDKRVWNQQEPARDRELFLAKFTQVFAGAGHPAAEATALAESVLPDLLTYDRTRPAGFPNGRTLTDDVINMGIAQLTGGAVPPDGLKPHTDLLATFPYLGVPHQPES